MPNHIPLLLSIQMEVIYRIFEKNNLIILHRFENMKIECRNQKFWLCRNRRQEQEAVL